MNYPALIWDEFHERSVSPESMDELWALGWRHFGTHFFRYNWMVHEGQLQTVVPLRVNLSKLVLSKGQRRVLRRNEDLSVCIEPAALTEETDAMFERHKTRFTENIPDSLATFLSAEPATVPCPCLQVRCLQRDHCIAVSFFDAGVRGISCVYAVFEPDFASRRLGIFTMLKEMIWAQEHGKEYAYPGYATLGRSHYDYKKQFTGLEGYDWAREAWVPWAEFSKDRPLND
jgi:arginyl-tRNA--protein-N-Asp/Glu arginylyltransferase